MNFRLYGTFYAGAVAFLGMVLGTGLQARASERSSLYSCPEGWALDSQFHVCASQNEIAGPFTAKMIASCEQGGGGETCRKMNWPRALYLKFRGDGLCQPGASFDANLGACTEGDNAYGPFTREFVNNCLEHSGGKGCYLQRVHVSFLNPQNGRFFCPAGFQYNETSQLCESRDQALGPFPPQMVAECKNIGGTEQCDSSTWDKDLAAELRGTERCPVGTSWDGTLQACLAGDQAYGPFLKEQLNTCLAYGGGPACLQPRWHKSMLAPLPPVPQKDPGQTLPEGPGSGWGMDFVQFYFKNYESVKSQVGFTTNGCAAFATTVLRKAGIKISYTAWAPTMMTWMGQIGWIRIDDPRQLLPGDVIFTRERPTDRGTNHVFVFAGYGTKGYPYSRAIDNQGKDYVRGLDGRATGHSAFWMAFRHP